ncbi:MAG: hypothetical protein ACRD15_13400, partial [Vicinamibacterales bacterium]
MPISRLIGDDECRLVSVLGRGGMGKTALALTVLERLAGDDGAPLDGIAFLSARTSGLRLELLFLYCAALLDEAQANAVRDTWGDSKRAVDAKVDGLLEVLSQVRTAILLDNFDDVLDAQGGITDPELLLFVDRALRQRAGPTLVITSRMPIALPPALAPLDKRVALDDGLPESDAVDFLRELDPHSEFGLRASSDEALQRLVRRVHAVPRALEVAASLLAHDPFMSPDDVALNYFSFDEVVERIVEENYRRLDSDSRRVLEAVAVFRRPVLRDALEFLLQPFVSNVNVQGVAARLARSHTLTVDRTARTVSLHPIDSDYVYSRLEHSGTLDIAVVERRAAAWYRLQRGQKTAAGSTILEDFQNQLLEFEHLMRAQDFDAAMDVLAGIDNLLTWAGHASRVKQMLESLAGKLTTARARMQHAIARGDNQFLFGQLEEGRLALSEARAIVADLDDRADEARIVYTLAGIENQAGMADVALTLYQEALPLLRAAGDTEQEKYCIFDLALAYAGRRHGAGLTQHAAEMHAFAERMNDAGARALAINVETLALLARGEWPAASVSAQSLFDAYRHIHQENWFPAVHNMLGLAALGMRQWKQAAMHFRQAFVDSMAAQHFHYAARSAFNLAWTRYREQRYDGVLEVANDTTELSTETKEMTALAAVVRAASCAQGDDAAGEARALLACAGAANGSIDLWDASDIAAEALARARAVGASAVEAQAIAFLA